MDLLPSYFYTLQDDPSSSNQRMSKRQVSDATTSKYVLHQAACLTGNFWQLVEEYCLSYLNLVDDALRRETAFKLWRLLQILYDYQKMANKTIDLFRLDSYQPRFYLSLLVKLLAHPHALHQSNDDAVQPFEYLVKFWLDYCSLSIETLETTWHFILQLGLFERLCLYHHFPANFSCLLIYGQIYHVKPNHHDASNHELFVRLFDDTLKLVRRGKSKDYLIYLSISMKAFNDCPFNCSRLKDLLLSIDFDEYSAQELDIKYRPFYVRAKDDMLNFIDKYSRHPE